MNVLTQRRIALAQSLRLIGRRPGRFTLAALLAAAIALLGTLAAALVQSGAVAAAASGAGPEVSLFLRAGTAAADIETVRARLAAMEGVRQARLIPRDQALTDLGRRTGITLEGRANPLPDVIVARFALLTDPAHIEALATAARGWPQVELVRAENEGYGRLAASVARFRAAGRFAAALAGLLGLALLGLALAQLVRPQRAEAAVLELSGAAPRAIARPYAYLGGWAFAMGAAGGALLATGALIVLQPHWLAALSPWGVAAPLAGPGIGPAAAGIVGAAITGTFAGGALCRLALRQARQSM